MRIAVDARELVGRPTGVGRYLAELLEEWSRSAEALRHEWHIYAHHAVQVPAALSSAATVLAGGGGTRWEQTTFSRALGRSKPDVLFAPGYTAPLMAPCPVALTIHDVSFAAHPEWFSFREGVRRRTLTAWSARRARMVLTDSRFSRDEILVHVGLPPHRVRVIPLGIRAVPAPAGAIREPLILHVGSIFRRRHVDRLIDAFVHDVANRVPHSRLEIVGDNRLHPAGDLTQPLRDLPRPTASRVSIRSYVDEGTLRDLYARASLLVLLSEYEGFGLTPLEALAQGVAPVVLDTRVAREVYGPAARFVASLSRTDISDALVDMLTSSDARRLVLASAGAVLERYQWPRTAAETLSAIEEAAGV